MGTNGRREYHRAVYVDPAFRFANAAGVKRCEYSFHRRQERLPQLERVLHEQVCA